MPWNHTLTGYVPGIGNQLGSISVRSRQIGTLSNDSLRLANLVNAGGGFARQPKGITPILDMLGDVQPKETRGELRLDVPPVIVRFGPVTGATISGTTVTVTIGTGHNIQTGEDINIRQVVGSTELNTWFDGSRITRLTGTTFSISGVASITAFSTSANSIVEVRRPFASIAISGFVNATGVFTTSSNHGLAVGDKIYISQLTGLTFTGPDWLNKEITVRTVPSATTFTIVENAPLSGSASGGVVIPVRTINNFGQLRVIQPRTVALAAVSNANPAVYTTNVDHGFQVGDRVFVSGIAGTAVTALNAGSAIVRTTPLATTFTLEDNVGAPISGAGSTATANTGSIFAGGSPTAMTSFDDWFSFEVPVFGSPVLAQRRRGPFKV